MKIASARVSEDCEANKPNAARRVVLRRTKRGLVACSRRTWSKHAPLEDPSLPPSPRICLGHWDLYRSYPAPSPRRSRALIHLPGQQERPRYSRGKKGCNQEREQTRRGGREGRFLKVNFRTTCRPRIGTTTCLRRINIGPYPTARIMGPGFQNPGSFILEGTARGGGRSPKRAVPHLSVFLYPPLRMDSTRLKVTCGNRDRGKKSREVRPRAGSTSTRTMVPMFTLLLNTS